MKIIFLISSLFLIQCVKQPGGGKEQSSNNNQMLEMKIEVSDEIMRENEPFYINVTLTNVSDQEVLINSRLAVGFEDDISREIYFQLKEVESGKEASLIPLDINREDAEKENFQNLKSKESISTKVNFANFYIPEKKGKYELTGFYQADENSFNRPDEVIKGIFKSNSVIIEYK